MPVEPMAKVDVERKWSTNSNASRKGGSLVCEEREARR